QRGYLAAQGPIMSSPRLDSDGLIAHPSLQRFHALAKNERQNPLSKVEFNDRVAIVAGAGAGLGKEYAMELARGGVTVVVNDFGGARDGTGGSATVAEQVVAEIEAEGGVAMAAGCSVTDMPAVEKMVADTIEKWGH